VATDILGVSARAMTEALIAGQRDPQILADMARARMRTKIPALQEALVGRFDNHHAFLCRTMLDRVDAITTTVDAVNTRIAEEIQPLQGQVDRLATIPGISARQAQVILAEIGTDMTRFPTADHLASWAGMCPGIRESAGKHYGGATRKGDTWLRGALGEAAASAAGPRTPTCRTATAALRCCFPISASAFRRWERRLAFHLGVEVPKVGSALPVVDHAVERERQGAGHP
jgi:transposase